MGVACSVHIGWALKGDGGEGGWKGGGGEVDAVEMRRTGGKAAVVVKETATAGVECYEPRCSRLALAGRQIGFLSCL